mmetsp:Transcript_56715/g.93804  ORF Transcript_56715/g.93804 Transcript_56715/m.93804 type:complete len:310 (+) Transcript_56715:67-996(+)
MRAFAFAACLHAAASWRGCNRLDFGVSIDYTVGPDTLSLCLQVPALQGGVVLLEARALSTLDALHLCLQADVITPPRTRALAHCGDKTVALELLPPTQTRTYVVRPSIDLVEVAHIQIRTRFEQRDGHEPPLAPAPPHPPWPENEGFCAGPSSRFISLCHDDHLNLCPNEDTPETMMKCFAADRQQVSQRCLEAMHELSRCLNGPQVLYPMEIASFLLLATASVVLICALIRCCCRRVCIRASRDTASETSAAPEEVDLSEDEESTVIPLPSGVKHNDTRAHSAETEEDDDALPTYGEVVDGASLATQT